MQCTSCNSKWDSDQKVTNCPFCQAPLASETPQVAPNSNEAKIQQIVKERGAEIYLKKEFIGLVLDYFPNNDFGRLLKAVIEKQGAVYVSKLKNYPEDEIQPNYVKILDKLETESFIAKDVLAPAVELLCFGLGYSVTSPITQAPPPPAPTQAPSLSDFEIENGELKKYIGSDSVVTIPNSVTSIGYNAFENCTSLCQITIPNSVTSIGYGAFNECTSLSQVTIPNSVTSIDDWAFHGCTSLSQVTIPNSVTSIGESAFKGCKSLSQVTIPNSVTSIGGTAFFGCKSLSQVTIPNSVTSIGDYTFFLCNSLSQVTIPNSVNFIGDSAFQGCDSLSQVTIPNSVTSIGENAFFGCKSLSQVTIPNSVTSIGESAFYGCKSLSQVTIPNSVTSIGGTAFFGCNNLPEDVAQQIEKINYGAL